LIIINIDRGESDHLKMVSDGVLVIEGDSYDFNSDVLRNSLKSTDELTHIWYFNVKPTSSEHLLSDEESIKASFYRRSLDRERWVFCRGLLKILLGYYTQLEPKNISINEGEGGKPELSPNPSFSFNLSHSEDLAVYAFSNLKKVGVDVERIRDVYNVDRIAANLLTPNDLKIFKSRPSLDKKPFFFRMWTAREACYKALGGKLSDYSIIFDDDYSFNFNVNCGILLSSIKIIHFLIHDDYLMTLAIQR
jgi:phosphopantetheinyl transferase